MSKENSYAKMEKLGAQMGYVGVQDGVLGYALPKGYLRLSSREILN